jgi:hypothetical protein
MTILNLIVIMALWGVVFILVIVPLALLLTLELLSFFIEPSKLLKRYELRCPACSGRGLVFVRGSWFSYFRCTFCGERCKTSPFTGKWCDTWDKNDDAMYREREAQSERDAQSWKGFIIPQVDNTTCGRLLGRKRTLKPSLLVNRTRSKPPALKSSSKKEEWLAADDETTVGRLLRKKLFRSPLEEEHPLHDRWLDF